MTQYVKIVDGAITAFLHSRPRTLLLDDGRTCSNPSDAVMEREGWREVVETSPEPPDGQEVVDSVVQLVKRVPTVVWHYQDVVEQEVEPTEIERLVARLEEKGILALEDSDDVLGRPVGRPKSPDKK